MSERRARGGGGDSSNVNAVFKGERYAKERRKGCAISVLGFESFGGVNGEELRDEVNECGRCGRDVEMDSLIKISYHCHWREPRSV